MIDRVHPWINPRTGVLEWRVDAPSILAMDSGTPTYQISHFRCYVAGSGTTCNDQTAALGEDVKATYGAAGSTYVDPVNVVVRVQYDETNLGDPSVYTHDMRWRVNGSGDTAFSGSGLVQVATSGVWAQFDTTTQLLSSPSGSFVSGLAYETSTYSRSANYAQDDFSEYHLILSLDYANLNNGDLIQLGVNNSGTGTTVWSADIIEINKTAPTFVFPLGSFGLMGVGK